MFNNVDSIHTALIGPSAARICHARKGRAIVINMGTVKEDLCAALTTVPEDQHIWTVVQVCQ